MTETKTNNTITSFFDRLNNLVDDLDEINASIKDLRDDALRSSNAITRAVKRMTHTWFNGKLSGSLDSIATIISKKGGNSRDDSTWVQFVNKLKRREILKRARIRKFAKKWKDAQKELFGSVTKADALLNRIVEIDVEVLPQDSETRVSEKAQYTISQLLNVWQNNHNESLRAGLASNGFTESVIEEIDKILPEKVKE